MLTNLTTKTYRLPNDEKLQEAMRYLAGVLSHDEFEQYVKYVGRWCAISFWYHPSGSNPLGFAAAEYFSNGIRLMTRMHKSKLIRYGYKVEMQKNTYEIVKAQHDIAKELNADYVFMSRENNPKSLINYKDSLDFTEWTIEEDRHMTGNFDLMKSSWQYIMWAPIAAGAQLDLRKMTKEEWNETFTN